MQAWTEQDYFSSTAFRNFPNGFLGRHGDLTAWYGKILVLHVLRTRDEPESHHLSV